MINQIICAAIRFPDGTIIRGHRHGDCFITAGGIKRIVDKYRVFRTEQGFIDAHNQFVDRKEAMNIQIDADIPTADKQHEDNYCKGNILFSEDLY